MTAGFINRNAKLLAAIAISISMYSCVSKPNFEEEKLDEMARAGAFWNCLTSYASDNSGIFPHSLNELLVTNWYIGESFLYDDQGEVRWAYPLNDRTTQTSRPDQVLFRSAKEIDGVVLEMTVAGKMRWRDRNDEITNQEVPEDLKLSGNSESEGYPRFIVVLGETRLSFYNTWTKDEVLKRIEAAEHTYSSYYYGRRLLAGRIDSPDGREVITDEWDLFERNGQWRFEIYDRLPGLKEGEWRVVSKDFDSMQEAVDWYVHEKVEPLLDN